MNEKLYAFMNFTRILSCPLFFFLLGFPQPTIKWYKNQEEIKSSRALRTEFDGSTVRLIMENVEISDSDTYKCIAENDVGIDQIKAKIVVQREIIRKIGNYNIIHTNFSVVC